MTTDELHQLQHLQASAAKAAALLKAMSNARRLLILCTLLIRPGAGTGALSEATGLSPSATSQHLAKMRDEGLVERVRDGQRMCYAVKPGVVEQIIAVLKTYYCPQGES